MFHETEHSCDECGWVYECYDYPCPRVKLCANCVRIARLEDELMRDDE